MNKNVKVVTLSVLMIGIGVVTASAMNYQGTGNRVIEMTNGAVMKFKETSIQLGEIPQGTPRNITFELYNEGNQPLIIESVKPSCGCTGVDYSRGPIKPNETGSITAVYDAKNQGEFTKMVTVYSNASDSPQILKFSGSVK